MAATDRDDIRATFSNPGPQTDLAAPGVSILSTYLNNSYYLNDGTSMAAPHVSALAALVWSLRPDWDWVQVKNHLKATAVDVNASTLPGPDSDIGHGRIDAEAALVQAGAKGSPSPWTTGWDSMPVWTKPCASPFIWR